MEDFSPFQTLAEVALGIAGFGGVVVAFRDRSHGWHPADSARVLSLLLTSFGALFLSLLPSGLALAHITSPTIWRVGSACMILILILWIAVIPRRMLRDARPVLFPPAILIPVQVLNLANLTSQIANVIGAPYQPNAWTYYFGIVWMLCFSALIFGRVIFARPAE